MSKTAVVGTMLAGQTKSVELDASLIVCRNCGSVTRLQFRLYESSNQVHVTCGQCSYGYDIEVPEVAPGRVN